MLDEDGAVRYFIVCLQISCFCCLLGGFRDEHGRHVGLWRVQELRNRNTPEDGVGGGGGGRGGGGMIQRQQHRRR